MSFEDFKRRRDELSDEVVNDNSPFSGDDDIGNGFGVDMFCWGYNAGFTDEAVLAMERALEHIKEVSDTIAKPAMTHSTISMRIALEECYSDAKEALTAYREAKAKVKELKGE